jgi:hypothetical protein
MKTVLVALAVLAVSSVAQAQTSVMPPPAKPDAGPVEHGARPDPQAVRPGSPAGDAPSASVGTVVRDPAGPRRVLGLPVSSALLIGGVIAALLAIGGLVIPAARRRERARGNGTYGRP